MLHSGWSWKGADEGVAALEIARQSVPDLQAVLFGTDPRPADLPGWIEYAQDPDQRDLVDEIYNGSAVYLCPSHAEGWHLPPAEAMGCGCAVVSTDIDGVRDYAHDGTTALLSPVRDPEALAANLVRVFQDDGLRLRLAQTAHHEIQQYRWEDSTEDLEHALFDLGPRCDDRAVGRRGRDRGGCRRRLRRIPALGGEARASRARSRRCASSAWCSCSPR